MKRIRPGDKVKVYCNNTFHPKLEFIRYGEAIGVNDQGKIMLNERKDFATLSTGHFQHFRNDNEVVFLNLAHPHPVRETITRL